MVFLDQMKNMKIYRQQMFLPTLDGDKKKHSLIMLLTPNYESSNRLMNHPMTINRLRYQSYYLERDVSYYIYGKVSKSIEVEEYAHCVTPYEFYTVLCEMSAAERNKLPDNVFGLPDERKYPLDTPAHVKSAIKFFNYVDPKDEERLARNIKKAIKRLNVSVKGVGEKNRFSKYYSIKEDCIPVQEGVTVADVSDSNSYVLNNYLNFSGYYSDVKKAIHFVTPSAFRSAIKESGIVVRSADDVPSLFVDVVENATEFRYKVIKEAKSVMLSIPARDTFVGDNYNEEITNGIKAALVAYNNTNPSTGEEVIYNTYSTNEIPEIDETYTTESYVFNEMKENSELYESEFLEMGNIVTFFNEANAGVNDQQLRKLLFAERMKQRKDLVEKLDKVKADNKWIKYAFPEMKRLQGKNAFIDLYYYNELFFKNNVWKLRKGFDLYLTLLDRLLNDPRYKANGYTKKTLFIPVLDWDLNNATRMWMYRESINPISIIFELMKNDNRILASVFKDTVLVFFDKDRIFKMDFSLMDDIPKTADVFRRFIMLFRKSQAEDTADADTEFNHKETPEVIKANIADQIEISKGIDLTPKIAAAKKNNKVEVVKGKEEIVTYNPKSYSTKRKDIKAPNEVLKDVEQDMKDVPLTKTVDTEELKNKEEDLESLAAVVNDVGDKASSTDNAYDYLDNDLDFKAMLIDAEADDGGVKIDATRAARMNKLNDDILLKSVKGKTVKELLQPTPTEKQIEVTSLKVASPNPEWQEMKYMNFDKDYDLNKDIVACFYHFTKTSKPIGIRNIKCEDHSTSEDRLDLYTVEMEDFRGKRFTIKLDIPKVKDNRYLLRGNTKSIQTQFFNMPILKTNLDTCQIVSNYQKIFIYRVNTNTGRSLPTTSKFLKAISKYEGKDITVVAGDNSRICNKYNLPIDYIDIASVITTIETKDVKFYFDQSEIRSKYPNIDDKNGIPIGVDKKYQSIIYYNMAGGSNVATVILSYINNDKLNELYDTVKPSTSGTYSRCNMLNVKIPMIVVLGYLEGLTSILKKANIEFELKEKITNEERRNANTDFIRFSDGYLIYNISYPACMLLNGLKECDTMSYSFTGVDSQTMWLEFLDNYGGRIKSDGLDNFYDCLIDPMTKECLEYYHLPTDFAGMFLYANNLLADNKFIKHTDTSSRRIRRSEMVAAYTFEALSESYAMYANMVKHNRSGAEFSLKQSAVIDKILLSPISSDDSVINALYAVENTNAVTYKGKAGLNDDRSYSIDKRIYDDSMLNVLGMSTNFSAGVGITRQATINMNIEGERGYVKSINSDTSKMNAANTLSMTEALTPFGSTRDDADRTYMTFIQTAKHMMRTAESDPLLVTNGAGEAMPYVTIDKFAYKAKQDGTVTEVTDEYVIVQYKDGSKDFVNLKETVEKNSDAGFFVPLKLDKMEGLSVGKKIKAGDILAYDRSSFSNNLGESGNIAFNIGKLTKIAIINTDDGFEDSGFCTESLSKSLAAKIIRKVDHVIDKDSIVYSMLKIGDRVEVEDPLIIWQNAHEDEEANVLMRVMKTDDEEISEFGRKSIKSEVSGVIKDIKIYRTVEMDELSPSLQKIVKAYEAPYKALQKKLDSEGIEDVYVPATYKLEPTGKLKKAQEAILIEFYLEYNDSVAVGDKIVYFAANKAVIKNVIPDKDAPYTDFRPNEKINAFVSQVSIDKRLVNSIPINGALNTLMIELDRNVRDILGIQYDDSKV